MLSTGNPLSREPTGDAAAGEGRNGAAGLARERTALAWQRTALSLAVGLLVGLRLLARDGSQLTNPVTWIVGVTAVVYLLGVWRFALHSPRPGASTAIVMSTAGLTLAGGLGALGFALSHR